jgi:hypothetical protein
MLPPEDLRRTALSAAAEEHRRAGIAAVTGEHYEGGHWLGSFAVYLTNPARDPREGALRDTGSDCRAVLSASTTGLSVLQ